MSDSVSRPLARRAFLQQTVAFSALAALRPGELLAQNFSGASPVPNPANPHMLLLGDWGADHYPQQQRAVADQMKKYVDGKQVHPQAMFLLGDNWYGNMLGGLSCPRWQSDFEQMYPTSHFPGPCYAVLGNHDYEHRVDSKVELELAYPQHVKTRWTMPGRWYTFQWPQQNPQITFICLDSNLPGTKDDPFPWSNTMSKEHTAEQEMWFQAELAKPRATPFVAVVCHHPLYTNGIHKDNKLLIKRWDSLIRQAKVDFWITGHDHDLQHIEFAGHPTSFVISGGGGAELVDWTTDPAKRGPFGAKVLGFSDLELDNGGVLLRHIDVNGQELHVFRKSPGGKVDVLKPLGA
ncbi:MAG: metallophosphoesterase [Janthinobacterium lividum]